MTGHIILALLVGTVVGLVTLLVLRIVAFEVFDV